MVSVLVAVDVEVEVLVDDPADIAELMAAVRAAIGYGNARLFNARVVSEDDAEQ